MLWVNSSTALKNSPRRGSLLCRTRMLACTAAVFVWACMFSAAPSLHAQRTARASAPVELKAEVNARQVQEGDIFQLDFSLILRTSAKAESFQVPVMSDFEVVRSQRAPTSSKTTIINGRRSSEQRTGFTYLLRAKTAGRFRIDSASVKVNGRSYRSAPIEIEVVQRGGGMGSDSTSLDPRTRFGAGRKIPAYFLDVRFEKNQVYVGEQVVLNVQLYAREQTEIEINDFNAPKPNGFWVEVLDSPNRVRPTQRSVGDETFLVYPLMKIALFPLEAGEQKIDSIPLGISVSRGGFWGRRKQMTLSSEPIRLTVLPLPVDSRPANFVDGNVGRYELRAMADKRQVPLGQPVTFRVSVKGEGNIGALSLPLVPQKIAGARVFPPNTKESKSTAGPRVQGEKVQEILVQPTAEGRFMIPALTWSYFDPGEARFIEMRTRPVEIDVLPSKLSGESGSAATKIAQKLRPFRTRIKSVSATTFWETPSAAFALLAAWLGCALVAGMGIRRRKFSQSAAGQKKQAQALRRQRMETASQKGDLGEVERVLLESLSACCGEQVRGLQREDIEQGLIAAGLSASLAQRCGVFLKATQASRYAPASADNTSSLCAEGVSIQAAVEASES